MQLAIELLNKQEMSIDQAVSHIRNHFPGRINSINFDSALYIIYVELDQEHLNGVQRDWLHLSSFAKYVDSFAVDKAIPEFINQIAKRLENVPLASQDNQEKSIVLTHLKSKVEMPFEKAMQHIELYFPGMIEVVGYKKFGIVQIDLDRELEEVQKEWLRTDIFSANYIDYYDMYTQEEAAAYIRDLENGIMPANRASKKAVYVALELVSIEGKNVSISEAQQHIEACFPGEIAAIENTDSGTLYLQLDQDLSDRQTYWLQHDIYIAAILYITYDKAAMDMLRRIQEHSLPTPRAEPKRHDQINTLLNVLASAEKSLTVLEWMLECRQYHISYDVFIDLVQQLHKAGVIHARVSTTGNNINAYYFESGKWNKR